MHGESLYGCTNVTEFSNISVNSSRQEHEANLFASEFLLPSSSVQNIIPNRDLCIDDIKMIARTFKMSFTSCAIKAVASCLYTQIPESRINTELFNYHQKTE